MIGHSLGELGCAYADGCFTAEETIMAAYARGRASLESKLPRGLMAAVGLNYEAIKDRLPHDIDVACHNSSESSTISGPTESVSEFVEKLKSENVFVRLINASNISFHSRYMRPAAPILLNYLTKVCNKRVFFFILFLYCVSSIASLYGSLLIRIFNGLSERT